MSPSRCSDCRVPDRHSGLKSLLPLLRKSRTPAAVHNTTAHVSPIPTRHAPTLWAVPWSRTRTPLSRVPRRGNRLLNGRFCGKVQADQARGNPGIPVVNQEQAPSHHRRPHREPTTTFDTWRAFPSSMSAAQQHRRLEMLAPHACASKWYARSRPSGCCRSNLLHDERGSRFFDFINEWYRSPRRVREWYNFRAER